MTAISPSDGVDVIDLLAGIQPGDAVDVLRAHRTEARLNAQRSYLSLFAPTALPSPDGEGTAFTVQERFAVASFTAGLHGRPDIAAFYADGLARAGASQALQDAVAAEATHGRAPGPYGHYPAGPLSREDVAGPSFAVGDAGLIALGLRLSAALAHAHLLVLHPRDAKARDLQSLLDAGWSTSDIVTLSQLVAFLSFQIRLIIGLRALAGHPPPRP